MPLTDDVERKPLMGSVTLLVDDDEALFSTGEVWEAEDAGQRFHGVDDGHSLGE